LADQAQEAEYEQREAKDLVWPLVSDGSSVDRIVESTGLSEAAVREARNAWMVEQRIAGASNRTIGETVGMSAEAVRRSIKRACKRDGEPVQEKRARRKADKAKEFKESIREIVTENPGFSLDEIAQIASVRPVEVRRNLTRLGTKLVLGLGTSPKTRTWSDEPLLQALRVASTKSTPLTTASYNALVSQNQIEGPTAQIMYKRFGSWREACKAAGVRCGEAPHDNYTSKWSKADLEALVVDFLFSPEHGGMFRDFENWLGGRDDPPSVPTFRSRLDHWDSMKQTAIRTIIDTGRINELRDLCE
jgi:transposase